MFHVVYASPGIYSRNYSLAKSVADAAATTCTADAAALKRYIRSIDRTYAVCGTNCVCCTLSHGAARPQLQQARVNVTVAIASLLTCQQSQSQHLDDEDDGEGRRRGDAVASNPISSRPTTPHDLWWCVSMTRSVRGSVRGEEGNRMGGRWRFVRSCAAIERETSRTVLTHMPVILKLRDDYHPAHAASK